MLGFVLTREGCDGYVLNLYHVHSFHPIVYSFSRGASREYPFVISSFYPVISSGVPLDIGDGKAERNKEVASFRFYNPEGSFTSDFGFNSPAQHYLPYPIYYPKKAEDVVEKT